MRDCPLVLVLFTALLGGCGASRSSSGSGSGFTTAAATTPTPRATPATTPAVSPTPGTVTTPVVQPVLVPQAKLLAIKADEFGGGFGTPPPVPTTPPPPTISFQATFENTGPLDLSSSDATLAVEVRFADAATPTQVSVKVVPLSRSIPKGTQAVETVNVGAIPSVLDPVSVACAIVKVDPATGSVVSYVSPAGQTQTINPSIFYPP